MTTDYLHFVVVFNFFLVTDKKVTNNSFELAKPFHMVLFKKDKTKFSVVQTTLRCSFEVIDKPREGELVHDFNCAQDYLSLSKLTTITSLSA